VYEVNALIILRLLFLSIKKINNYSGFEKRCNSLSKMLLKY
jgi:hypothetical protein